MKISINWLNDFVNLDEIQKRENINSKFELAEKLAEKLTGVGFEVEEIEQTDRFLNHVVVGLIEKIEKHKDAERLFVCQVNIGERNVQIITSATNVFEGALVPVSLDGADLANGIKIKSSKIRGEASEGMFCSGEELGISDGLYDGASINGILIFKDNFVPGTPVAEALCLNDVVLDVSITANRPDAMSVIGIAREINAIYRLEMKNQDLSFATNNNKVENFVSVENKAFDLCPRYMASAVSNVKIEKSPLKIRARLFAVGVHPICNIVDITNYVLFEYGQPMHAFDANNIGGKKIVVRRAENGEEISVLNGNSYKLSENNLVIADENRPMVIAGVIGGTDSCINDETTTVIFEAASFERSQVRKTSRSFGLRTDSSARFEKGIDLLSQELGMRRALNLISEFNCGEIASGIIDQKEEEVKNAEVVVSKKRIDGILGIEVKTEDIVSILSSLGISCVANGDELKLSVPPYRFDIETDADVAEEVIRMYGYDVYDNAKKPFFEGASVMEGKYDPILALEREIKRVLIMRGYYEINSYSLVPNNAHEKLLLNENASEVIKVSNPLSDELGSLRISMAHSLLSNVAYNFKRNNKDFRIFESGRTYHAKGQPIVELPVEKNMIAFATIADNDDFFVMKGVVENIWEKYDLKPELSYSKAPFLHPGISADITDKTTGKLVARFGKINPKVALEYEIPEKTFYGEIFCDELNELSLKTFAVKRVSKFPIVERDLALVVDENITVGQIEEIIKQCCGKNYNNVKLFDIYRNKNQLGNKKSLAFRIKLLSDEKTLSEEEINKVIDKILRRTGDLFGATLRV